MSQKEVTFEGHCNAFLCYQLSTNFLLSTSLPSTIR